MLKEFIQNYGNNKLQWVLILILMEHAQREFQADYGYGITMPVLILILMEHAQRVKPGQLEIQFQVES